MVVDPLRPWPEFVDHEDSVGVAVEREAEVEATRHHACSQVALVGRLQRVGGMVRERAVELGVHDLEFDAGQPLHHRRHDESAHAVGGVGDDLHRADVGRVDEADHVLDELGEQVLFGAGAALRCRRERRTVEHLFGDPLDVGQPGVDTDRTSTRQAQLHAVVSGRVVRRGEHRARGVERSRREVHQVGRGEADVDHVEAVLEQALRERVEQLRSRRAHVAGDDDPARLRRT